MDGKDRWLDNIFVELLWRSEKYKNVYLRAYGSMATLREGIKDYFLFYNKKRTHQSLAKQISYEVYFKDNRLGGAASHNRSVAFTYLP
jgi:putative transposase